MDAVRHESIAEAKVAEVSPVLTLSAADLTSDADLSETRKRFILSLVCSSHTLNHIQSGVTSVLFPVMMKELGFGFLQLGVLSAAHHFAAQGLQVIYGLLAAFVKRPVILGVGNIILGVSVTFHAFLGSYSQLLAARVTSSVGASAQNPMGSSILSGNFPGRRGWVLSLHNTAGNVGTFLAPAIAAFLLLYFGWRQVFLVLGLPSILMGVSYFLLRDRVTSGGRAGQKGKAARASWNAYRACLKNRNIVLASMILTVGAAGRGSGFNAAYLVPYFMERFDVSASTAGMLLMVIEGAGVVGPLAVGWFSDRVRRRALIVQVTLLLSSILTLTLVRHSSVSALLILNLILYGVFVNSRSTLTQAMIGDFATEEMADAAFSIYYFVGFMSGPFWTLVTGFVMDRYGFNPAFYVASSTYIAGMILLFFIDREKK